MEHFSANSIDSYSIAGDVSVIAICSVVVVLLMTSYVSRTRTLYIFLNIIALLVCAAVVSMVFHHLLVQRNPEFYTAIYVLHVLYHAMIFNVFFLFGLYITEASNMEHRQARVVAIASVLLFAAIVTADIVRTVTGAGVRTAEDGAVIYSESIFLIGYALYIIFLLGLLYHVRGLLYRRVMYGFYGAIGVAILIRVIQMILGHSSLTTMTFVLPVIAMLYIMHSNPYNVTLGTVDVRSMEDMVRTFYARKEEFIFLSMYLPEFDGEGKELPEEIRASVRQFSGRFFRSCVLFQISNGQVIMLVPKRRNPDYEKRIRRILEAFQEEHQKFNLPYKIVIGESIEEISRRNEYVSFIQSIHRSLPDNTVHRIREEDVARFNRNEYILQALADIHSKRDLEDPRVLAFCQPVMNLQTGQFDTAEALMRLKLDKTGIVYPDQFIPLAEQYGYIHVLTEIILHKTCQEIRRLTEEGFQIDRISVNVSVLEIKDEDFCNDIDRIIESNGLTGEQIAIEMTESRSEADFMIMKEKIEELRRKGIRFYLDDFGTGYSNMERIMGLPFDIIKFDRSMVIAAGSDERSEKIVENLAHMFREMDYSVLYEGVENDVDVERCQEMSASYLQGYRYSRPVPIMRLREFLKKGPKKDRAG
ncbi:MAG: EAL domain-containing protein [Firmicutes bacterium]|nr:EAL domain-containing protein [Bacillota bacterium]